LGVHGNDRRVLVQQVENDLDAGNVNTTAHKLEEKYDADKDSFSLQPGGASAVAWESTEIARKDIYTALQIPQETCKPDLTSCNFAPPEVTNLSVSLSPAEMKRESEIAGRQLAKAGYRLASLLNLIWP